MMVKHKGDNFPYFFIVIHNNYALGHVPLTPPNYWVSQKSFFAAFGGRREMIKLGMQASQAHLPHNLSPRQGSPAKCCRPPHSCFYWLRSIILIYCKYYKKRDLLSRFQLDKTIVQSLYWLCVSKAL